MIKKRNRHSKPNQRASDSQVDALVIGDCIFVKPGIKDPDFGTDISGWQGRVTEVQSYGSDEIMHLRFSALRFEGGKPKIVLFCFDR